MNSKAKGVSMGGGGLAKFLDIAKDFTAIKKTK